MEPSAPKTVTPGARLKSIYLAKLVRNRSFSLRAFARTLGVSHSHLSRVFNDQSNLSLRQALGLCERLGFSPSERREFLEAVAVQLGAPARVPAGAGSDEATEAFVLEVAKFRCISEWYHGAILELTALKGFRPEYRWIAKRLGLRSREVRLAVARLERLGLLETGPDGWKRRHLHLAIPTEHREEAIRGYHRQMIRKGLEALEDDAPDAPERRDITGTTTAVDPARLPEAKRRIARFRKKLTEYLSGGNPSGLYQINLQLFPLAKGDLE